MSYQNTHIAEVAALLNKRLNELKNKADILKAVELKALYAEIPQLPPEDRGNFGKEINTLKTELEARIAEHQEQAEALPPIDVTAPFDVNTPREQRPSLLSAENGTIHPLMRELNKVVDIFTRMGFTAVESRQIDDDYHMFGSLNFPEGHPARDDYDTFMTEEGLIAPAHTSTMQNRVLVAHKDALEEGKSIAVLIPGRVFRNEDLDARHEHTFYQYEGVFVGEKIHAGMLVATLKTFFKTYFGKEINVKTQPFYFPFTEPSFEFAASCVFCDSAGCSICSQTGWIELGGCGMIHPNVLKMADINPVSYAGFAWGFGLERMVMLKNGIEDIRHFEAGRLDFLRQFK